MSKIENLLPMQRYDIGSCDPYTYYKKESDNGEWIKWSDLCDMISKGILIINPHHNVITSSGDFDDDEY